MTCTIVTIDVINDVNRFTWSLVVELRSRSRNVYTPGRHGITITYYMGISGIRVYLFEILQFDCLVTWL